MKGRLSQDFIVIISAYKVEVVSFKQRGNFQHLTMTILAPLKHGEYQARFNFRG